MIFLQPQVVSNLGSPGGLLPALQQAIELEHATIPTYLYALYSLDPAKNAKIAALIRSVVKEEMLHLTLACNLLNAIGGSPVLDRPTFVPDYPGPMPGAVEAGLIVPLAPLDRKLVKEVFMVIEEPEHPLNFPVVKFLALTEKPVTIGSFYRKIREQIKAAGPKLFSKPPRRQVTEGIDDAICVVDVKTALEAIDLIVEQGEGTPEGPTDLQGDYAHYYRFAEIYHGRAIRPNAKAKPNTPPDRRYAYAGAKVPLDPSGVWAVPRNPKAADYAAGSAARHACDTFNYTYTSLMKALHAVFNGEPERLRPALGLMFSLQQQAMDMMSGTSTGGAHVGPSFEYQPVNPA